MDDLFLLYDQTEQTSTRYVGFAGKHARFDLAIITTAHFYGKKLVCAIQSGRNAILSNSDALDTAYLMRAFGITDEDEANEFAEFLHANL